MYSLGEDSTTWIELSNMELTCEDNTDVDYSEGREDCDEVTFYS